MGRAGLRFVRYPIPKSVGKIITTRWPVVLVRRAIEPGYGILVVPGAT